jgi:hypothetical protein
MRCKGLTGGTGDNVFFSITTGVDEDDETGVIG